MVQTGAYGDKNMITLRHDSDIPYESWYIDLLPKCQQNNSVTF